MKPISFHLHDDKVAKLLIINFAMLSCHKIIKIILQMKIVAHAGWPAAYMLLTRLWETNFCVDLEEKFAESTTRPVQS
jgi:hypothetical protein